MTNWNALQWDGDPGHYEVYYLTVTERTSGVGLWIRYTMLAPLHGAPTCSLWLAAMDPGRGAGAHGNAVESLDGEPRPDCDLDGVSGFGPRFGRELGPNTPVVGRFDGRDFRSTGPLRVARNSSTFGLTSWHLKAADGDRRL